MGAFGSPFIVPLGAFVVAIVAIISGIVGQAHARRIKAEQRMAMLQRGMTVEQIDLLVEAHQEDDARKRSRPGTPCAASPTPAAPASFWSPSASASSSSALCSPRSSATAKFSPSPPPASFPWPSASASSSTTTCRSANSPASASKSPPTRPPTTAPPRNLAQVHVLKGTGFSPSISAAKSRGALAPEGMLKACADLP